MCRSEIGNRQSAIVLKMSGLEMKRLDEVCDIIMGQSPPGSTYNKVGKGLPFFQGKAEFGSMHPTASTWCSVPKKIAEPDDILISVRAPVGPTNMSNQKCCIGRGLTAIRPKNGLEPKYVLYYLRSIEKDIAALGSGSTFQSISKSHIANLEIPIFPRDEQQIIVAAIETQFSRLDEAVAGLKRVKANLKRYKAAVLKAAVEGRIVEIEAERARREGRSYETGEQLLKRILETRRRQWKGTSKYKESAAPDMTSLPELPKGWVTASIEQIVENFDGVRVPVRSKDREKRQGPYPYYGASGVIDHVDSYLFDGDYLLIAEDGANLLTRSTPIAFRACGKFWVNNHAHIVQTQGGIPLAFLEHYLNGKNLALFVTGTAQPKLTQAAMNKIPVPLPPLAEEHRIVAEVDRRLSLVREVEAQVDTNCKRAEHLRQAILSKAFAGKLVN